MVIPFRTIGNELLRPSSDMVLYAPLWNQKLIGTTFYSMDSNRHLMTNVGATWGKYGRTFDGTDDVIYCGSATVLDNLTGNQTHMVWIKPTSLGENNEGYIVGKGTFYLYMIATARTRFTMKVGAAYPTVYSPASSIPNGSWACVFAIFDGVNVLIDSNGTTTTGTASAGPIDAHSASNFNIGDRNASDRCFEGIIGEVISWNRALSQAERNNVRMATKWRYQS